MQEVRRRVECAAFAGLAPLVTEAMGIADTACWALLEDGDANAFARESAEAAMLLEFAVCAGVLP
jgi:hypothetical protein